MRIAVVGPQNVGKTTFVKDFVVEFKNYKNHTSSLKDIAQKKDLKINQMTGEESQQVIMDFLYDLISKNQEKDMIFDRCLIDNYVYSYCAYLKGNIGKEFIDRNKQKVFEHLQFLDVIFFIPTSLVVNLEEDKFRDTDRNFIDLVNKVFIEILLEITKNSNIKIYVLSGTREERLEQIRNTII